MHSVQPDSYQVIAIDGPAASGKSSVARELARWLRFVYVNSGAIYRAITWHILVRVIRAEDVDRVGQALESTSITCCVQHSDSGVLVDNIRAAGYFCDNGLKENVSRISRLP